MLKLLNYRFFLRHSGLFYLFFSRLGYTPTMEHLEKEPLEQLLQIVPNYPAVRLLHFCDGGEDLPSVLADFCAEKAYEYQINALNEACFTAMQTRFETHAHVKTVKFSLERPRYMIQGKMFEYVFVTASVEPSIREAFLQRVHPTMKNGGNILIFIPKGDHAQRFEWMRLLEENYFVATNTIDDLFEHYDLLISKKMHGWGG